MASMLEQSEHINTMCLFSFFMFLQDVVPDWQQAASNILVAVGNKYINDIMEEILSKFQPGILPHFFVVQTLASLSESNVYGMVPFLNAILGTMLPMLGMAKQDNMKWVFSSALSHFSESILEYLANLDKAPDPTVRKDTFSSEIYAAYDILYCNWIQSRDSKVRLTVAEAVGSMSHLMAHDKLEEQLPKLIPTILSLYKKNTEHYVISKVGRPLMTAAGVLYRELSAVLIVILRPLQVCAPVDYSNPPTVKNHNEVLRCFSILANTFPDRLVMFVLQKLENSNERIRMGSLAVLRHLINSSSKTARCHLRRMQCLTHKVLDKKCFLLFQSQRDLIYSIMMWSHGCVVGFCLDIQFLAKSLVAIADDKWSCQLAIEATRYLSTYNQSLEEKSFLYRCIGVTLQQCSNKEVVQKQLQEILISARHNDAIERAVKPLSPHLSQAMILLITFAFIYHHMFSMTLDNDLDVEKMKSTLILCYGYVALHAPEDQILSRIDSDILRSISKHFNTKGCYSQVVLIVLTHLNIFLLLKDFIKAEPTDAMRTPVRHLVMTTCANLMYPLMPSGLLVGCLLEQSPEMSAIDCQTPLNNMVTFHNLGSLLGRLAPRCTDPNPLVRRAAIDCIYTLLYIQLRYEGFSLDYKDDSVERLITLRESMDNPDHSVLYKTCSELIISKRLPQQQLNTLIFMLFEGLVDSQSNCSRASSVLLNTLLKSRGAGLQDLVSEMLEVLHIRLQMISEEQVKVSVAQSILILATQHLQTVINTLISYPLPFDSWSCEMWIALGADSKLASQIMEMLMEKLNVMAPYVDKKESMMRAGLTKQSFSMLLCQMTCALKEMMLNGQSQEAVVSLFPQLFSSLLVRLGSSVGVTLPKDINSFGTNRKSPTKLSAGFDVCGVAVEALRILLARAQLDDVVKPLDQEGAWDKMKDPQQHITGVTLLARAMARHAGPRLPAIVECLCPCLNNIYECQRVTITAFFSELLNHHVVTELMMMDVLMNNMMERISDPCCTVRMLAVRGLGNIAVGSPEKVHMEGRGGGLLAAMSSGMEEKDDPGKHITLEAMSGLSKVLLYLDKKNVQLLVVYIFMKIKPFLESVSRDTLLCCHGYHPAAAHCCHGRVTTLLQPTLPIGSFIPLLSPVTGCCCKWECVFSQFNW
uniref:Maestro heat-like repeat family member 1 n=1 Tax=Hucho hucho TaxID=62062 RepID=A0A4W5KHG1_9TELE